MYIEPYTANPNPNRIDSNDRSNPLELEDEENHESIGLDEIGMFGDFCLMCGEMIDGHTFDGSAYCSEQCEYHQRITSESDWCDLSSEGYQLPSYGCSTTDSSAKTSPLNSPHLQPSGRLAILCSGPPASESLLPFNLGERLLGAKAVAERYLEKQPSNSWQDQEGEAQEDSNQLAHQELGQEAQGNRSRSRSLNSPSQTKTTLASTGSHLKSRPALAQLTDLEDFWDPSIDLSSSHLHLPSSLQPSHSPTKSPSDQLSSSPSSRRRVSEPILKSDHHPPPPLYHSSFSLTSLSSLSPSSSNSSTHPLSTSSFSHLPLVQS